MPAPLQPTRFEVLPFDSAEREAGAAPRPLTLTVTCSPRHGVDRSVEVAARLRAAGHTVVVHVAARMVRDEAHLDAILERMAAVDVRDVFLIGGDAARPAGRYAAAGDLLGALRAHPLAPRSIGIAGYPEGHPHIGDAALERALREKAPAADYLVTQLCFDPEAVVGWLRRTRDDGIGIPVFVGLPGLVDARRLLEISLRVGVGASIAYARKQRGLSRLLGRRTPALERLHAELAPLAGERALGVAGVHWFTFNRLVDTVGWADAHAPVEAAGDRRTAAR